MWSPWESLAARQGLTIIYDTTDRLDVCPHLRSRIDGPSSAVCVPLIVMGRILGVLYAVSDVGVRSNDSVERIESVARRAAVHLGLVRAATKTEPPPPVDPVTGLPEQRAARERLVKLSESGTEFSLALVDIDHFGVYRELHGDEAANEALQLLAESLVSAVRPTDMVARVGDFEFAVVLPGATAQSAAQGDRACAGALDHRPGDATQAPVHLQLRPLAFDDDPVHRRHHRAGRDRPRDGPERRP